jgi:hypothetical protein
VIGHDDEAVKEIPFLIAVSEEDGEEKFGVCGSLKDAVTVVSAMVWGLRRMKF